MRFEHRFTLFFYLFFYLSAERNVTGSLFQSLGTELAKALSPYEVKVILYVRRYWSACDLRNLVLSE